MKSLLTVTRPCPRIRPWTLAVTFLLLLLSLWTPAYAGHWESPTYVWSGSAHLQHLYYHPVADNLYNIDLTRTKNVLRGGVPVGPPANPNSPTRNDYGPPNQALVTWNNTGTAFAGDDNTHSGPVAPPAASSDANSSVFAVFHWQRQQINGHDDATDNPPEYVYMSERATLYAQRYTFAAGGSLTAYADTPWPADFVSVTGHAGSRDLQVNLNNANWQYDRQGFDTGTAYQYTLQASGTAVHRYAVQGDTVSLASVSFEGAVSLAPGYARPQDSARGVGAITCYYAATPVDFGITLSPFPGSWWYNGEPSKDPAILEINALAGKEWIETPVDQPLEYRWRAGLSPLVAATIGQNPTSPAFGNEQKYIWSHAGNGITVLPPEIDLEATPEENNRAIDEQTLPPSTAQKHLRLDMGGQQEEWAPDAWPKSSTARVGVTGGPNTSTLPAKVKVNWHIPYSTTFAIHVRIQVHMPNGGVVDLGELGDGDLMDDIGSDWRDAMMVDRMRRGTPAMFGAAGATVGRVVVEGVVEGSLVLASGGTTRILRAPLTSEAAEAFLVKARPWIDRIWTAWTVSQLLNNKDPGILEVTTTVVKVGTNGTSHVPVAPDGTITTSTSPKIVTKDVPPRLPLRAPNPGEVEDAANAEALRQLREGNAFVWQGKPSPPPSEPGPTPPPPNKIIDWVKQALSSRQPLPLQQPDGTLTQIRTFRGQLYYYTQDEYSSGDHWDGGDNAAWEPGFYYTTLRPSQAGALTRGAASFCLYGHPYVWDNGLPVFAQKILLSQQEMALLVPQNGDFDTRVPRGIFYSPDFVGQKEGVPVSISFQPGTPGADDVPDGTNFPANDGQWVAPNNKANGIWNSRKPGTIDLDERLNGQRRDPVPIQFHNGYPDFWPWNIKDKNNNNIIATLPLQHGNQDDSGNDFIRADAELAAILLATDPNVGQTFYGSNGNLQIGKVRLWRKNYTVNGVPTALTWHHNQDMRTMQLVPGDNLNNNISHDGGGKWARQARW
ncbi:hypothetical protein IAD21_03800 [Abditibacteriota bacterium]|nr:hypothetical protein IAD21_03800 [Abditibacteriota bacterium]